MTIDAHFTEVSFNLLEKLKENRQLLTVFVDCGWNPDSDYWKEFRSSCTPEEFERFEKDVDIIIAAREIIIDSSLYIQSRQNWHGISFLLTGSREYEQPFLVKENPDGDRLPLVNAVFGGTKIGETGCGVGYDAIRYLTPDEVKEVAEALSKISAESFEERYEQAFPSLTNGEIREVAEEAASKMKSAGTDEERMNQLIAIILERVSRHDLSPHTDDYLEVVRYYKDAAEKGNAMLLWLS